MKTEIFDIEGKKTKTIDLPKCFSSPIRENLILKVEEAKKSQQPFSPSLVSGKQHSASGLLKHHRKVWKSQYGRGMSRVPRKVLSRRGSQFNWVGAEVSNTRGGRTAHPSKTISRMNSKKINKKELRLAMISALSATCNESWVKKKYESIEKIGKMPFIVESKITALKTKEIIASIKKIMGNDLMKVAEKNKKIRSGRGKMRGRKYKTNAGLLIVLGEKEKIKTSRFDVQTCNHLGVSELAKGGPGRLTLYTEQAIKEIGERYK
jgi:large subunit ribosomal protein L4e